MSIIKNEKKRIKQAVSRDNRKHQETMEGLKSLKQNRQINSFLKCQPNLPQIPTVIYDPNELKD